MISSIKFNQSNQVTPSAIHAPSGVALKAGGIDGMVAFLFIGSILAVTGQKPTTINTATLPKLNTSNTPTNSSTAPIITSTAIKSMISSDAANVTHRTPVTPLTIQPLSKPIKLQKLNPSIFAAFQK
jgi:hypothetical protein